MIKNSERSWKGSSIISNHSFIVRTNVTDVTDVTDVAKRLIGKKNTPIKIKNSDDLKFKILFL